MVCRILHVRVESTQFSLSCGGGRARRWLPSPHRKRSRPAPPPGRARPLEHHLLPSSATVGPSGRLSIGGCDVLELAERFGTPLFVYDEGHLRARCREAVAAWGEGVAYATKAFLCRAMARLAVEEGMSLDVSTGGELHVALDSGVPPSRLVLHGNNKSEAELARALEVGVGRIVVDSFDEIPRLTRLAPEGATSKLLVRVTPGVEPIPTSSFARATTTRSSAFPSPPGPPPTPSPPSAACAASSWPASTPTSEARSSRCPRSPRRPTSWLACSCRSTYPSSVWAAGSGWPT